MKVVAMRRTQRQHRAHCLGAQSQRQAASGKPAAKDAQQILERPPRSSNIPGSRAGQSAERGTRASPNPRQAIRICAAGTGSCIAQLAPTLAPSFQSRVRRRPTGAAA